MTVVRWLVAAIGIALLAGGALSAARGGPLPLTIWLIVIGLVFALGTLFERIRYKRIASAPPGRGWVATGERFVDPATGRLVDVHFRADTGERAYVDAGAGPPRDGA